MDGVFASVLRSELASNSGSLMAQFTRGAPKLNETEYKTRQGVVARTLRKAVGGERQDLKAVGDH
jgi:hypothetical protein